MKLEPVTQIGWLKSILGLATLTDSRKSRLEPTIQIDLRRSKLGPTILTDSPKLILEPTIRIDSLKSRLELVTLIDSLKSKLVLVTLIGLPKLRLEPRTRTDVLKPKLEPVTQICLPKLRLEPRIQIGLPKPKLGPRTQTGLPKSILVLATLTDSLRPIQKVSRSSKQTETRKPVEKLLPSIQRLMSTAIGTKKLIWRLHQTTIRIGSQKAILYPVTQTDLLKPKLEPMTLTGLPKLIL